MYPSAAECQHLFSCNVNEVVLAVQGLNNLWLAGVQPMGLDASNR